MIWIPLAKWLTMILMLCWTIATWQVMTVQSICSKSDDGRDSTWMNHVTQSFNFGTIWTRYDSVTTIFITTLSSKKTDVKKPASQYNPLCVHLFAFTQRSIPIVNTWF
jgi:hypothetical protein